jgi:oligopeptide/dipeptide ABC transporter ATP-binding protein
MALVCHPSVLIADEPTTALDVTIQAQVLQLIMRLQSDLGMAVLFITHDLGVVSEMCDAVVVLYAGQVIENAMTDELMNRPRHPYSHGLIQCMPTLDSPRGSLKAIVGSVPRAEQLPDGCRFHPRCEHVADVCRQRTPDLTPVARAHQVRCARWEQLDLNRCELGGAL